MSEKKRAYHNHYCSILAVYILQNKYYDIITPSSRRKTAAGCFSLTREVGGIREFRKCAQLFVYTQADDDRRPQRTCKFVIQTVVAGGGTLLIKQSFRYDVPVKKIIL